MPVDEETRRTLNMIRNSPDKAVRVADKLKTIQIVSPDRIEPGGGVYWLYGATELETGIKLETVFVVDTGPPERSDAMDPARLRTYYWWIMDNWYPQGDYSGLKRLDIGEDEAFPFRWSTTITLAMPFEAGTQYQTG